MRLPTNKGRHVLCRGSVSWFTLQLPGVATKNAATKVGDSEQDTKAAFHDFLALRPASSHVDTWMQWHDGAVVFETTVFLRRTGDGSLYYQIDWVSATRRADGTWGVLASGGPQSLWL